MKKYRVQSEYKILIWFMSGLFLVIGVMAVISSVNEGYVSIFLALFLFCLSLIFNNNKIYMNDEYLHISFLRLKKKIKINEIKSVVLYKGAFNFGHYMYITTDIEINSEKKIPRLALIKFFENEKIPLYYLGYNKKLIMSLEMKDIKIIRF